MEQPRGGEMGQRLDTNRCGWQQCRTCTPCVPGPRARGPGLADDRAVPTAVAFPAWVAHQDGPWQLYGMVPQIPGELRGWPGSPGGQEERLFRQWVHCSAQPRRSFRAWAAFPSLLFFHACELGTVLIKELGSSNSSNKPDAPDRCPREPVLSPPSSSLRSV